MPTRSLTLLLVTLLLAGCWRTPDDRPRKGRGRRARAVEVVDDAPIDLKLPTAVVAGPPRLVLLLVLDTVRADHTSLCGYARPTTPVLQEIVAEAAPASTCRAATPGTWTLPSHASFLTGLDPTAHRLISKARPLPDAVETLAETYAAEGWQTALFSANPTLNAASGIQQGFGTIVTSPGLYAPWRGAALGPRFTEFLGGLDTERPTFLVVNLFDAHDPYPAVPAGVGWVPRQRGLDVNLKHAEGGPVGAYLTGAMPAAEEARFLAALRDTYDYGVSQADRNVGRVLDALAKGGWLEHGYRAVITSDHGENLGEHRSLRHDGQPWETVARVPLLFLDTTQATLPKLPEPFPGTLVHALLRTGRLPTEPTLPASYAIFHDVERAWRKDSVAVWSGAEKLMWAGGDSVRFDLGADPGEVAGTPVGTHPLAGELDARVERLVEAKRAVLGVGEDAAMKSSLEAIGYVE